VLFESLETKIFFVVTGDFIGTYDNCTAICPVMDRINRGPSRPDMTGCDDFNKKCQDKINLVSERLFRTKGAIPKDLVEAGEKIDYTNWTQLLTGYAHVYSSELSRLPGTE
jgi:hypothetical protein